MKKVVLTFLVVLFVSCTNTGNNDDSDDSICETNEAIDDTTKVEAEDVDVTSNFSDNALSDNMSQVFSSVHDLQKCFIVISKLHLCLNVYEDNKGDTIMIAHYPVCLSFNKGPKQNKGDMRTPEASLKESFTIVNIQNSSDWCHDFGDGRGSILAYGHWFLRLQTPGFSGIGIHGSTNNENSVPGRASEGCIRLKDSDIIHLKEHYAFVGMKVAILGENDDWMDFEKKAIMNIKNIAPAKHSSDNLDSKEQEKPQPIVVDEGSDDVPKWLKVIKKHAKLRLKPSLNAEKFTDDSNNPIFPNEGDNLQCIGKENTFYKVYYNYRGINNTVYIEVNDCKPYE